MWDKKEKIATWLQNTKPNIAILCQNIQVRREEMRKQIWREEAKEMNLITDRFLHTDPSNDMTWSRLLSFNARGKPSFVSQLNNNQEWKLRLDLFSERTLLKSSFLWRFHPQLISTDTKQHSIDWLLCKHQIIHPSRHDEQPFVRYIYVRIAKKQQEMKQHTKRNILAPCIRQTKLQKSILWKK